MFSLLVRFNPVDAGNLFKKVPLTTLILNLFEYSIGWQLATGQLVEYLDSQNDAILAEKIH